jgi:Neutral/alkaline non-lysosomal ceramidase, N-terminal
MATKKIRAGFGVADITPPLPFPMAGMGDKKERLATKVRDPLMARALAFSDGKKTVAILAADLLMITADLRHAVDALLAKRKVKIDGVQLSGTHTHSAPGGFLDREASKLFMGTYRPAIFELLVERFTDAIEAAVKDLAAADLTFGEVQTVGLNYNRRHPDGPIDRTLGLLTIKRRKKNIRLAMFGAHPVVAAFREYNVASADYPGMIIRQFEAEGDHGMFLVGPVGGVNVLFPEGPMDLEFHLNLLTGLLREQIDLAGKAATPIIGSDVDFAAGETTIKPTMPRLFPDSKVWADVLALPLRLWVKRFGRKNLGESMVTRVPVVRIGDLVFTGMPADLGAGVGLAARERIEKAGYRCAVVASQTDDYVGYVHLPAEYQQFNSEDKAAMWMTIYENGLGLGGRDVGRDLLKAFDTALAAV